MEFEKVEAPFPVIMGNEEETGMIVDIGGSIDEPYDLADNLSRYIPESIMGSDDQFMTNGFRIYVGGSEDNALPTNIERATPECVLPEDLTKYIRVGEFIMDQIAENYATQTSIEEHEKVSIRLQRRVVDSNGNRKGCHDNFGVDINTKIANRNRISPYLLQFVATRSLITGAGHVSNTGGMFYSQKIDGLSAITGYGYMGTVARVVPDRDSSRVEIRCNDINISDWAVQMRLGGMGMFLALYESDELAPLSKYFKNHSTEEEYLNNTKTVNEMYLMEDGTLEVSSMQNDAIDYQQKIAELAMKRLGLYADIPSNYFKIAEEIYDYCDDFRKVTSGQEDIALLSDRADWAAKMCIIRHKLENDRNFGIIRDYTDLEAQAIDMKYDYREITSVEGEITNRKTGYGYKLRDKQKFRLTIPAQEVKKSTLIPPSNTRALLRSQILKDQQVKRCDWSSISFVNRHNQRSPHYITLESRATEFDELDEIKLLSDYNK